MFEPIIKKKCPICNSEMIVEGVHNGVCFIYPPFHCENCGYSEKCEYEGEFCKHCDQYYNCFKVKENESID